MAPIACSSSALTGQEGSIFFKPAGTSFCLLDFTDFPAGTDITVPAQNDYRVGDAVVFEVEGTATLDSGLTEGTTYYVVAATSTAIQVSLTDGGTAAVLAGDGGQAGGTTGPIATLDVPVGGTAYTDGVYTAVALTGGTGTGATADITVTANEVADVTIVAPGTGYTAGDTLSADDADLGGGGGSGFEVDVLTITVTNQDTPGSANHISIGPADFAVVCQVREFSVEITREELDVTTLPCGTGSTGGKYASFRATQAGYAAGTGTMTVYFTDDQTSLANRLLANVMLKSQDGAEVKLYVNTVGDGAGAIDDNASLYIEAGISITSMSLSVNPDDPTSAELAFNILDPKNILGTDLTA